MIRRQTRKKTEDSDTFSKVEGRHVNPEASLEYARGNKSIIYVTAHEQKTPTSRYKLS